MRSAWEPIETPRLRLRAPVATDAATIFARYSSDPVVTKYLGWPRHTSVEDTRAFIAFSDEHWRVWAAGPLIIEDRTTGSLLGSTGVVFEAPRVAVTGYVLARDAWGHGYATEALRAIVAHQQQLAIHSLYALCHPDNAASMRVLDKCGFIVDAHLPRYIVFPNLGASEPQDCVRYVRALMDG